METENIQVQEETKKENVSYNVAPQPQQPQQIIIQQAPAPKSNGIGTAGFVFALLSLIVCWLPVVDGILGFLGFLFSFIGLFKQPRGLAIAGFILSLLTFIIAISIFGSIAAIFAALA